MRNTFFSRCFVLFVASTVIFALSGVTMGEMLFYDTYNTSTVLGNGYQL